MLVGCGADHTGTGDVGDGGGAASPGSQAASSALGCTKPEGWRTTPAPPTVADSGGGATKPEAVGTARPGGGAE